MILLLEQIDDLTKLLLIVLVNDCVIVWDCLDVPCPDGPVQPLHRVDIAHYWMTPLPFLHLNLFLVPRYKFITYEKNIITNIFHTKKKFLLAKFKKSTFTILFQRDNSVNRFFGEIIFFATKFKKKIFFSCVKFFYLHLPFPFCIY